MSNKILKNIIMIVGIGIIIIGFFIPPFSSLSQSGMEVLCIFVGTLILWLTFGIGWPSILSLTALCFVKELGTNAVLQSSFGNSTIGFLIFTFLVTYALSKTSIIRRIALWFVNSKIASKGPWHFTILFFTSVLVTGLFISPTVLFFVYLPIIEEIFAVLELKKGDKMANMLMMGLVFVTAVSSGMTPIAHVFPILAMNVYPKFFEGVITYSQFMSVAIPVGLIVLILMMLVFRFIYNPEMKKEIKKINPIEGKMDKSEKIILWIFIAVVVVWVIPSSLKTVLNAGPLKDLMTYIDGLGTAMPPLVATVLLCIVKINDKPLLDLKEGFSKGVVWQSIIMCCATLALSGALTNADIGIKDALSLLMSSALNNLPVTIFVLIITLWAAIQTNLSSNMVTSTLVSTVALTILSTQENMLVNPAVIAILVGALASYAFATPPAMPSVSIAGSSGWTTPKDLLVYGFLLAIIAVIISTFVGYPIGIAIL